MSTNCASTPSKFELLNGCAYQFLLDSSHLLTHGKNTTTIKHGAGHSNLGVNGSTAGFVLTAVILLILITIFMAWRVYKGKKFFSKDWEKEHGPSKFDPNRAAKRRESELAR